MFDADGNAVRPLLTEAFKKDGYTVIDPGPKSIGLPQFESSGASVVYANAFVGNPGTSGKHFRRSRTYRKNCQP